MFAVGRGGRHQGHAELPSMGLLGPDLVAATPEDREPADPVWATPIRFLQSVDCCCATPNHVLTFWCEAAGALVLITEQSGEGGQKKSYICVPSPARDQGGPGPDEAGPRRPGGHAGAVFVSGLPSPHHQQHARRAPPHRRPVVPVTAGKRVRFPADGGPHVSPRP